MRLSLPGWLHPAGKGPWLSGVTVQVLGSPFLFTLSVPSFLLILPTVFFSPPLLSFIFSSSPFTFFSFLILFPFILLFLLFPLYTPSCLREKSVPASAG